MSAKKIQFSLEFNADTKKAEQQIQKLQHALDSAISSSTQGKDLGLTPRLEEARKSAMQLKIALNNAMNVDTGKLNLRKFSKELSSTGLSVQQLANHMKRLGPEGVEAFNQMANAIAAADTKLFSLQGGMKRLANTFMNTVRYQASAAAINEMTSAITNAISYTKELDKSLTDIMMVTEYSREEMNSFAVSANKAAKALSISTNAYAKASLIYFQQGYDIGEAMKRAETTIRLAHATGESAQEVSEWMTAIWNNFDNGTKALEYYGDVLAKLGAKTASSADEIAQGLSKFAAVAETVGLSYEYAASALATLTAETRQSADVVGTALKTLFSRMESLQLGETLDDGTTLGKYSLALQSVGVDIKDTNGQLKDMDQILDETAAKWSVLSKDQQVALAQSVAGVRQYTQFIALMDNYDIMQSNLELSKEASGSLKEMQNEYKNSIEGIKEESKAAGESLSDALLDEDDIKTFYKAVTKITEFVTELVDAFGGLEGILLTVSSLLMKTYQSKLGGFFSSGITAIQDFRVHIGNALQDAKHLKHNVTDFFQTGGQNQQHETKKLTSAEQTRLQIIQQRSTMQAAQSGGTASSAMGRKIAAAEMDLQMRSKDLTEAQKQQYSWQIKVLEAIKDELILREQKLDTIEKESIELETQVDLAYNAHKVNQQAIERAKQQPKPQSSGLSAASDLANAYITDDKVIQARNQHTSSAGIRQEYGKAMAEQLEIAKKEAEALGIEISDLDFEGAEQSLQAFVNKGGKNLDELIKKLNELQTKIGEKAAPAPVPLVTDIDTSYVATRSARVGTMTAGIDRAVSKAEGIKGVQLKSQEREVIGQQITSALETSKKKAQELGLNIKDLGFENATDDIALFVEKGNSHLNQLLQKLKDIQSAVKKAGATTMSQTVDDALLGTQNASIASMNTLEHAPNQQFDNVASSLEQLSSAKDISLSDSDKAFLQTSQKVAKALQQQQKMLQNKQKIMKKLVASGKTETEAEAAYGKMVQQNQKHINKFNKSVSKRVQTIKKSNSALGEQVKLTQGYEEVSEGARQATEQFAQAQKQGAEESYNVTTTLQEVSEGFDNFQGKANKVSLGDMFSGFMTGAMQVMSGFSMLQNGVAQLTEAFNDGEAGFDDYLSGIMAIIPGLTNMIAPIAKVMGAILAKAAASRAAALQEQKNANIEQAAEAKKQKGKIATAMANIAEWFTRGPAGWVIAAVGIAALAAIGIGMAVSAGAKQGQEKQQEAELETNREVNAAAGEVSKTLTGLSEQVDTFKNLRESGESTTDVLKDMEGAIEDVKFQISELISKAGSKTQWKFLEGATSALDIAYKDFSDGIITADEFQSRVDNITKRVNQTATKTALDTMRASGSKEDLNAYLTQVGTTVTGSDDLMKQAEKEFLDGTYESAEDAEKAWANAAIDAALGPQYAHEDWAESDTAISSLLSYAPTSVHRIIEGLRLFAPDGAIANKYGESTAKKAQAWAGRNQSKLAYANNIDFSTGSEDDWNQQYLAEMDKAKEAELVMEADKLGYDERTFETYVDILVDVNTQLDENDKTSKQLALNNLKLNKGLHTLSKNWADISETLREGKRGSIEYAEALGSLGSALEEAFGYAPTAEFIEAHLGTIEEVASGDIEALQRLQDAIAVDMVYNMEYKTAINGQSKSPKEIQDILLGLLSELDTSLELGENATVSQDYLDSLQAMLDSGQMTSDELDALMRAKGFEIEYDGWKEVPGPSSRTRQDYYHAGETTPYKTDYIETSETMMVPIINGQAPDVGTQTVGNANSKATIKKSSSASAINSSIFEQANEMKESIRKEASRYYTLDKSLERLQNEYDKISEARSRAFGQKHLDLLDQEIAKTNDLANVTKDKLLKAQEYLVDDRAELAKYGVAFDEYGNVSNYDALIEGFSNSGDNETYKKFKDALSQYEQTLKDMQDLESNLQEYANQVLDLKLEAIQYQVEMRVSIADDDLAYVEYQLEHLIDPAADAAKAIDLIGKKMDLAKSKSDEYRRGLELLFDDTLNDEQLNALKSGDLNVLEGVELDQAQIDIIRDYRDSLLEENRALYDTREEFFETISSGLESWNEQFSEITDEVAFFASVIDTYKNVIDLVGRKNLGVSADYMNKLSQSQVNNSIAATKAAKEQLEFNKQALEQLKAERDTALAGAQTDEERARIEQDWKETIKTAEEEVRSLEETVQSSWTDALTAASEAFETSVNLAAEAFEEAMSGVYGTFDSLQKAFDRVITTNERYISDYAKIYELSKLNRNISKQIDNNDSVKAKTALRELQEEINALQQSETEMTQYDLEYLQKKYDLRLAEIALEEAQNAKTQVRMRRDSEGNWGYVYTANEGAQDAAQQNYEDKLYASQNHTQQRISDLQNQIVENERNMIEELKALPLENYEEEKQRVLEYYADQERFLIQQVETAIGNSAEIYKVDWEKYAEKTGYKISANEDWVDSWKETVLAQLTGFDSLTDYYTAFEQATNTLVTELSSSYVTWQTNIGAAFDAAGQNVKTFAQDAEGALNTVDQSVKNIIDNLTNKETGLGAKAATGFQSLINAVHDKYAKYEAEILPYINANNKIIESLNTIIKKQGEVADVQSGYYGTVTVGGVTYRTADKYDTKEEAQSAASKMATDYIASAKAYNTDSNTNTYSNESLQAISSSVTTVDGLSGLNYGTDLKMVGPYVKPASNSGLNNSFGNYTPPPTAQVSHSKYTQNTYSTMMPTFQVNDDSVQIRRYYLNEQGHLIEDWYDSLSKGGYWLQILTGSGLGNNSGKVGLLGYMGTKDQYVTGKTNNTYDGIPSAADIVSVKQIKDTIKGGKYTSLWGFDTGGYTGSWDSSGRLAVLHQKEIVLNAHDTENFLAAVNIVRDIAKAIDLQAVSYQHQLAQLSYVNAGGGTPQTVQQEVTIRAEFPNATDRYEIEAAFASLVNDAAQFANRKK